VEVLRELDVATEDGEFLVLLGASGSGKTTALRMIAGLESTTSGRVLIGERDVTQVLPKNRDVAMVFQSYALYPHKSVAENIGYPLRVRGQSTSEIDRQVNEVASQVQLDKLLGRYPRQLSGGQRQRVALARAMVRRPAAFLMDEPLSNLDAKLRVTMRAELKHLHHELGVTTVYVTHDQMEAMTLATRIVVLAGGGIAQVGAPLELYERPRNEFVAQFIGSPAMNLMPGTIVETGARTVVEVAGGGRAVSAVPSDASDQGRAVNIGVRPEDFVAAGDEAIYEGIVDITEALGEVTLLYFVPQGTAPAAIAKLPGIHTGLRGNTVRLTAAPEKVHVFADGESLLYR